MTKILITGANGMLGKDLSQILKNENYNVIKTNKNNLDVTNYSTILKAINKHNPNIIIHCAAYTNVDEAELDITTARKINSTATENIAKICAAKNIKLIYISTDYVFDGTKKAPYKTSDIPNPINNYGLTKLEGEHAVTKYCQNYIIIRTSWLYGKNGKNFVNAILENPPHKKLKVVTDQIGCPTWTVELSKAILNLIKKNSTGIHHICSSGTTTRYNLAKEILKIANLNTTIEPCLTTDYPSKAKRPKNCAMDNNNTLRNWKIALIDYLNLK